MKNCQTCQYYEWEDVGIPGYPWEIWGCGYIDTINLDEPTGFEKLDFLDSAIDQWGEEYAEFCKYYTGEDDD